MLYRPYGRDHEKGQVIVLFALVLVVMILFAGIVVDLGMQRTDRQRLVNAMDSAALAGGATMPVDGSVSPQGSAAGSQWTLNQAAIKDTVARNYPSLTFGTKAQYLAGTADYYIEYQCIIGYDTSTSTLQLSRDVPLVCNPAGALGHTPVASDFKGAGSTRYAVCDPTKSFGGTYDKCNAVVVHGVTTTPYVLGPVAGIMNGSTGVVQSAACKGPCGASPLTPVDVALVVDRTGSMSGADTTNAKAAANALVSLYNPAVQWLGFGLLGPSTTPPPTCKGAPAGSIGTANFPTDLRRWFPIGLSGTGSSFATTYSQVSSTISCYTNSGTGTDLADPVAAAAYELAHNGRTGVRKGIILETDGQPNTAVGTGPNYCALADAAATAAKAPQTGAPQGIEVFTIGFGLDAGSGGDPPCPDTSGTWKGKTATALLASMSTQPTLGTTTCTAAENTDSDHFFCQPKSADLTSIFQAVAQQLAQGGAHLVDLCPSPLVTGVAPATGAKTGGTSVTLTGQYLSSATSVAFGGTNGTITSNTDTQIKVTSPAGTANATVDIRVDTACGFALSGSAFTYGP